MNKYKLTKLGSKKLKSVPQSFYAKDIEYETRPTPGEWGVFETLKGEFLGFMNLGTDPSRPVAWLVSRIDNHEIEVANFITEKLDTALNFRKTLSSLDEGGRLFYGSVEGLPGLIIDAFSDSIVIQIETSGVDLYRDLIHSYIADRFAEKKVIFWDKKSREKNGLPLYNPNLELEVLKIEDSGFKFEISANSAQKSGYYFDHRKNRQSFERHINYLDIEKKKGLDLFSYLGTWGFHQLRAGVEHVDFVDQGSFTEVYNANLNNNEFGDRGSFHKQDVFQFLKEKKSQGEKYDIISCDPPAFAKSKDKKNEALRGYRKLHSLVFELASQNSFVAFASCTHYVNLEEFESTILESAKQCGRSIKLVDMGIQAWDHPLPRLKSHSNYIKYLAYLVH